MHRILEEIKMDTAEIIATEARTLGLSVDEYLRSLLPPGNGATEGRPLYPEELAQAYAEWAASHDPKTPVLMDDSRESIYEHQERWCAT